MLEASIGIDPEPRETSAGVLVLRVVEISIESRRRRGLPGDRILRWILQRWGRRKTTRSHRPPRGRLGLGWLVLELPWRAGWPRRRLPRRRLPRRRLPRRRLLGMGAFGEQSQPSGDGDDAQRKA